MRCASRWLGLVLVFGNVVGTAGALAQEPLRPLPQKTGSEPVRAALGKALFHDPRLAGDRRNSCASCHDLRKGGADGRPVAHGRGQKAGLFNTPSIYNSSFNFRSSWIGQRVSIDALPQHVGAASWDEMVAGISQDPALASKFNDVYGDEATPGAARDALVHYIRSLVTPARFDRYLRGDKSALNEDEKAGYARFKRYGCVACHQGINVGGNMFARLGVLHEVPGLKDRPGGLGRFQLTGREEDRQVYRVPSLRNVALTAPYFHDGSVPTLEEAVNLMFRYQLGRSAPQQDKDLIVRFLHTLSGEKLPPPGALP